MKDIARVVIPTNKSSISKFTYLFPDGKTFSELNEEVILTNRKEVDSLVVRISILGSKVRIKYRDFSKFDTSFIDEKYLDGNYFGGSYNILLKKLQESNFLKSIEYKQVTKEYSILEMDFDSEVGKGIFCMDIVDYLTYDNKFFFSE